MRFLKDLAVSLLLALLSSQLVHAGIVVDNGSLLNACGKQDPLEADINCDTDNTVAIYDAQNYTFQVKAGSSFSVQVQLSTMGFNGDADLYLYGPNGLAMSSTERIGNDVITLPPSVVAKTPGTYSLQVIGYQTYTYFKLLVQTPSQFPSLVPEEAKILRSLFDSCCDANETILAPLCDQLQKASNPARDPIDDICSTPPNLCDQGGHLTKLSLVGGDGGNLVCPDNFPYEISGFKYLVELDMSSNLMIGVLSSVTQVTEKLQYLKRLYLRGNSFSGNLDCKLLNHSSLQVLTLSSNTLQGELPDCIFQSPVIEQISLESNMLSGTIPQFPVNSNLMLVDLSKNNILSGPAVEGTAGISGRIPNSVSNLRKLLYFDVSANKLIGTIPDFSVNLQTLSVAHNSLTGTIPPSLGYSPNMRALNVSGNKLRGQIPPLLGSLASLMTLALNDNKLTGGIQPYWQNQLLRVFDVSNNNLKFEMPYSPLALPNLQVFNVGGNQMKANFTKLAESVSRSMLMSNDGHNQVMVFNLSGNILTEEVPKELQHLRLFHFVDPASLTVSEFWDPVSPRTQSTFDISNTGLKTEFPMWLVPKLQQLYALGQGQLGYAQIKINGNNNLTCPESAPAGTSESFFFIEDKFDLTCMAADSKPIRPSGAIGLTLASPPPPGGSSDDGGDSDGMGVGALIGIIVGAVVLIAAAIGGWFLWRRKKIEKRGRHSSRRVPLTFNSAYDPTTMSEASGLELYQKEGDSNMMNAHVNPIYNR